jgi:small conductance mechanosensitive channel
MWEGQSSQSAQAWTQTTVEASWQWWWEAIGNPYVAFLLKLLLAILIVGGLMLLSKYIARFVSSKVREHSIADDEYTAKVSILVWNVIYYVLLVFSLLIGFEVLWFDFALILWGISFGIWFAFKEIFGNMIAWVMVLTNNEFKLWDIIEVEGSESFFGRIEEITIRYTVIRTLDLRKVIIPNLTMISVPIRTYDSEELVRLETHVTVHLHTDLDAASTIILDAVNSVDFVQEHESTRVLVEGVNPKWGITIKIYFYFDPSAGKIIEVAVSEVNKRIYEAFHVHGIIISYPHTVLTVDHNDKNLLASAIYIGKQLKDVE